MGDSMRPRHNVRTPAFLITSMLLTSTCLTSASRLLKQESRVQSKLDDYDDGSLASARIFTPKKSSTRSALTPEAAESTASASNAGVFRNVAPADRLSYATTPLDLSAPSSNTLLQPRVRQAQDIPRGGINYGSGSASAPIFVMGGAAVAQTYDGALSVSTTDSIALNARNPATNRRTTITGNTLTSKPGAFTGVGRGVSVGVTGMPVGSLATSGAANGKIVIAQADTAVAMSQTESSSTTTTNWETRM